MAGLDRTEAGLCPSVVEGLSAILPAGMPRARAAASCDSRSAPSLWYRSKLSRVCGGASRAAVCGDVMSGGSTRDDRIMSCCIISVILPSPRAARDP